MEYILISMLTIAVFTYIVSIVANKVLATPIHMKSLILCACCALLISLILPRMFMGFAGLSGTLAILIAFAMLSSYFIAYYYDNSMRKLALKEDSTTEIVFSEASQIDEQEDITFVVDLATILNSPENTQFSKACAEDDEVKTIEEIESPALEEEVATIEEITEEVIEDIEVPVLEEEVATIKEIAEEVIENIEVPALEEEVDTIEEIVEEVIEEIEVPALEEEVATIEEIVEEVIEEIEVPALEEEVTTIEEIAEEAIEEIEIPALEEEVATIEEIAEEIIEDIEVPAIEEEEVDTIEEIAEEIIENIEVTAIEEEEVDTIEEVIEEIEVTALEEEVATIEDIPEDSIPASDELDDLMDLAFLQKEQREFLVALETFRQALHLYPNSEVAPFLVVEIGTILKNLGSYDEAIEIFTKGRSLPSIINNSILEQEFINNIAYLHIVKNILVENSLELMPFSLIPESALKKIDDSFCEWRNQSSN